jgi:peptidoglycan L-alanyl-D-glutamate endopeptidase CwlK
MALSVSCTSSRPHNHKKLRGPHSPRSFLGVKMPQFGARSLEALEYVEPRLRLVLDEAIRFWDFSVLEGFRGPERQDELFTQGATKVRWPNSAHNSLPSRAVDIAPYPIDWEDTERFVQLAGAILTIARQFGIELRWGGDWDRDGRMSDERFRDLVHFEMTGES